MAFSVSIWFFDADLRFSGHTALAYNIIPDVERGKFRREECSPKAANLRDYIEHKGNRNVSITGVSGQGKSYLTMHLPGDT